MRKKRSLFILFTFLTLLFISAGLYKFFGTTPLENRKFESFTEEFFCQEVSGNTISLHYTLKEPTKFGIEDMPVTYGSFDTDTDEICASIENVLALLNSYRRANLSKENQLTYDVLKSYLENSLRKSHYALYDEPLAPLTGTQAQLPVLLSEYQFYNKEDADIYLKLLAQTPEYFQSILDFEKEKSKQGLFMSDSRAEAIITECENFINLQENNYLYLSFEERIKHLNLPAGEQEIYIKKNQDYVKQYVLPAYQELADGMKSLHSTGVNSGGLCNLPEGAKYYEIIVANETGSSRNISELQELTKKQMITDMTEMQKVLTKITSKNISPTSDLFKAQGAALEDSNPTSILNSLQGKLKGKFPEPPKADTKIKYVEKSMEEYLSPAFYMIPAIDSTKDNVIYLNSGHLSNDISLYTTLAHEGYPGHLYQNIYFAGQNPDPVRSLLSFGGYVEGWATYSEMMSYYFAPVDKEYATMMQHNTSLLLGLYALADMGIHYDGWSLIDTVEFFRGYGITDTKAISEIYDLILSDPANYLKYYVGYLEFLELKKDAMEKWGEDFSQERFHKAVLDVGPAPFDVVREYIF